MELLSYMREHFLVLDGGMGTTLQAKGLAPGETPEEWNLSHPAVIKEIHRAYFDAGSNLICTDTFGANPLRYDAETLENVVRAAMENARAAAKESVGKQEKYVALDIGPCGRLLSPYGDLAFEDAVACFAAVVRLGVKYGADAIFIETMNDSYETKAAVLAAKENAALPVFVSNAYGEDGKLMTGASPEAMVALLEGLGVDALGANCSLGPDALLPVAERLLAAASIPVFFKPNAGLPRVENGKTVYDVDADAFAEAVAVALRAGVRGAGGCCGTTPAYIAALAAKAAKTSPVPLTDKGRTVVSSYTRAVAFGENPVLIGERINPTGKKRFRQALAENDMPYVLSEGLKQAECGAHILDVNVGSPEIDEEEMLPRVTKELQAVCDSPLQLDTSSPAAMEKAMRLYNGKPLVNSVNGKKESMDAIFPLVKKYGGTVIALTLDEDGIPASADGRVAIAERIAARAAEYGIPAKELVFDPLTMTVSADPSAAAVTLAAVRMLTERGYHTSLGVSNVSFGLPAREIVNAAFFGAALEAGLSAAIMNPYSRPMTESYLAYRVLHGLDTNCAAYIAYAGTLTDAPAAKLTAGERTLARAIADGIKEEAAAKCRELLKTTPPLDAVNGQIIPALDEVGRGYEEKRIYLPQLLMSAEAAQAAFEEVRRAVNAGAEKAEEKCAFVLATVKGDIHDIGKNIVKLLLENYGFRVYDLGKDVPPEQIVAEVKRLHAPLAGLSALMTTTVPAMAQTVDFLRKEAPWCRVVVGGAVLTEEYARTIGADKYAKDAMATVRYAEEIFAKDGSAD